MELMTFLLNCYTPSQIMIQIMMIMNSNIYQNNPKMKFFSFHYQPNKY